MVGSYIDSSGTHGFVTMGATTNTLNDPLANGVTAAARINKLLGMSLAGTIILRRQRSKSGGWRHTPDR